MAALTPLRRHFIIPESLHRLHSPVLPTPSARLPQLCRIGPGTTARSHPHHEVLLLFRVRKFLRLVPTGLTTTFVPALQLLANHFPRPESTWKTACPLTSYNGFSTSIKSLFIHTGPSSTCLPSPRSIRSSARAPLFLKPYLQSPPIPSMPILTPLRKMINLVRTLLWTSSTKNRLGDQSRPGSRASSGITLSKGSKRASSRASSRKTLVPFRLQSSSA